MSRRPPATKWLGIEPGVSNPPAAAAVADTYTISGTINDSAGDGLSGVTVSLHIGGSPIASVVDETIGDGSYSFTGLSDEDYKVTPTKDGYTFNPEFDELTISGASVVADTMAAVWPIVLNFEGETAGETDFSGLEANWGGTNSVQLDDHLTMPALTPAGPTKCYYSRIAAAGGAGCRLNIGSNISMSTGIVWAEAVMYSDGIAMFTELQCLDTGSTDGIAVRFQGKDLQIRTYSGGSTTLKDTKSDVVSSTPLGVAWHSVMLKFNFATLAYDVRLLELGASATEDSGWLSGTISSPTYNNALQCRTAAAALHTGTGSNQDVGAAQIWVTNGTLTHPAGALVSNTIAIN